MAGRAGGSPQLAVGEAPGRVLAQRLLCRPAPDEAILGLVRVERADRLQRGVDIRLGQRLAISLAALAGPSAGSTGASCEGSRRQAASARTMHAATHARFMFLPLVNAIRPYSSLGPFTTLETGLAALGSRFVPQRKKRMDPLCHSAASPPWRSASRSAGWSAAAAPARSPRSGARRRTCSGRARRGHQRARRGDARPRRRSRPTPAISRRG